jgi:hypothetical protein
MNSSSVARDVPRISSSWRSSVCFADMLLCCLLLAFSQLAAAQRSAQKVAQRDPSAIAFLTQAISIANGGTDLSSITDFTASGTITHSWGASGEQGQLTIKSLGFTEFRLDSVLPEGTWSDHEQQCR